MPGFYKHDEVPGLRRGGSPSGSPFSWSPWGGGAGGKKKASAKQFDASVCVRVAFRIGGYVHRLGVCRCGPDLEILVEAREYMSSSAGLLTLREILYHTTIICAARMYSAPCVLPHEREIASG